jgi:hypothetical protein
VSNREYLRPKQAAERYNIDDGTLANWRVKDIGPPYVKHGGIILYPTEDFERWLAQGLRSPGTVLAEASP